MEGGGISLSTNIDTKVVQMKFDNAEFETRVAATLKSLEALNKGIQLTGATKGLEQLGAASKNIDLKGVEQGVDSIASKFKAMSVIGITALVSIAQQALSTGFTLVKSLTIDPIRTGLQEYETNLNSIQTILANTGLEGAAGLKRVTDALDELNLYSDQTIYNFSEMARNIGTFTAAGVKLDVATSAIKGIANLAAVSGSNAQQAASAMYQLSQALAAGKLTLIDWNSVVNAGMGGKVFQDALMETARVHGVAIDKMVKDAGGFRASLEKGWITSDILTETLSKFTGDLTAQQLKQMGYTEQQIAGILKMGKVARDAATKVKTASQLINTLQESAVSGWAKTWQLVVGDFDEARELFTGINNVIGGFINESADARNKVIGDWKELGGRTVLLEAIRNVFQAIISVVSPIKDAFREIFPAATGKQLYDLTVGLRNFTAGLKISSETGTNLRRTFAGIFAVLGIGWDIVREGVAFLLRLFGVVTEGSGSILEFTGNIGDFLVGLRTAIREGDGLKRFFQGLGDFLEPPIRFLKSLATLLGSIFDGFDGEAAAKSITGISEKLSPLEKIGTFLSNVWGGVFRILDNVLIAFSKVGEKVTEFFADLGVDISTSMQGIDLQGIMGVIAGGGFTAFILSLRNIATNVGDIFDGITDSLGAMQNTLRAATLLQIAGAIALLATAVMILSKIDAAGLTRSLTAITVMFTQLLAALLIFEKMSGFKGFAKMPFVAASMILLAVAVNILAIAVRQLSDLDWEELGRGLAGVTALLGVMIATAKLMPNPAGLISTGLGLLVLAAGLHVLVGAVTDLSGMSWEELAKGLTGVATLLGALTLFSMFAKANATGLLSGAGIVLLAAGIKILVSAVKDMAEMSWQEIGKGMTVLAGSLLAIGLALTFIPPTAPLIAAGIVMVAGAMLVIADAVEQMSQMSWEEIGKGMTVLAGALAAIGLALTLIPPTAPLVAAGILLLAPALLIIGQAIEQMGGMGWEEIAKGLVTLAGSLLIIGAAVMFMSGAVAGAAALLVVAASLAILAPVLLLFSKMSWEEIAKGLTMLAGVFLVLGVAGLVLAGIVPALLGLGAAILLLGVGVMAAGAGIFLFAAGLTALSLAAATGTVALVAMVGALAGLIPTVMKQIGLGLVAFAQTVAAASPALVAAIVAILMAMLKAIDELAPKMMETVAKLLTKLLETLLKYAPNLVDTGLKLLVAFLDGIANNIGKVVASATNLAIKFLEAIERERPKLIQKGVDYVIGFINGLANAIRDNSARMGEAGANLASAMIEGMIRGLAAGLGKLISKAVDVAKSALNAAKSALGISSPSKEMYAVGVYFTMGFINAISDQTRFVETSTEDLSNRALDSMRAVLSTIPDIMDDEVDMNPIITPVVDLDDIKDKARRIDEIFGRGPGFGGPSFTNASDAAAGFRANNPRPPDDPGSAMAGVVFNQYNNSPKALSSAEIYRQTNNQLSTLKGGLTK